MFNPETNIFHSTFAKFFLIFTLASILLSCSRINIEPIVATITELSACNENGEPKEIFHPETERIFACGYVETITPVDIETYWYYENELVFKQVGVDMDGHFYNYVEPNNPKKFPLGNYRIEILVSGTVVKSTEFRVE